MEDIEKVRNRIIELADTKEMSLHELCEKSKVSYSALNDFLNKKSKSIRIDTLYKICIGLKISLSELFDDF